jgi:leucyl aminopeptidase
MTHLKVETSVTTKGITEQQTDTIACFVEQDFSPSVLSPFASLFPSLEQAMAKQNFTGKAQTMLVVTGSRNGAVVDLIFVGLGKKQNGSFDREIYRRGLGSMARAVEARKGKSLALMLPKATDFNLLVHELAEHTVLLCHMAFYHFDEFITDKDRRLTDLASLVIMCASSDEAEVAEGVRKGNVVATSVNFSRYWIDSPPDRSTPQELEKHAREISKKYGLKYTSFNEAEIVAMGMGGLAAVSKGSDRDCHLVILEYAAAKKDAPTIALVGKGITFDSGGLSIKPAASMESMKEDMSGAAAVIATMKAIAKLKPEVNVIGITPLSENLPSGKATKPGDIATFYNGKTAEIRNTDAEGRLILADALAYATKHYKLDAILDIATLTGACAHALGPYYTGMMSNHEFLVERVVRAAEHTGDRVWRLPLPEDYKPAIKSAVADISNIGSQRYLAGTITAALFLQNFVGDVPWVHLDIAGTAFDVPDVSYYRVDGATGAGVRLMINLVMNWKA